MEGSYSIPGFNVLLLGETGTGKTYSIRTLVPSKITPFIIFTEPGIRTIADVPCPDLHYKYIVPAKPSFASMQTSAKQLNDAFDLEALTKLKNWSKKEFTQWLDIFSVLSSFTCDRCGQSFGSVDDWQTDRALVIDSLSGLSTMAMDLAAGSKPVKSPADWGASMSQIENLIMRLTGATQCHFILTGHLERERDEVSGAVQLMASTLGQKLAPKLPRNFDEVVMAKKDKEGKFSWSTLEPNVALKGRNLTIAAGQQPSFLLVTKSWLAAGGSIQPTLTEVKQKANP